MYQYWWRQPMNTSGASLIGEKIAAFQKIHGDFKEIMKKERCRTCSCFYSDVLGQVYEKIKTFQEINSDRTVKKIQNDFEKCRTLTIYRIKRKMRSTVRTVRAQPTQLAKLNKGGHLRPAERFRKRAETRRQPADTTFLSSCIKNPFSTLSP
jgi:hypothetical protein